MTPSSSKIRTRQSLEHPYLKIINFVLIKTERNNKGILQVKHKHISYKHSYPFLSFPKEDTVRP